MNLVSAIKNGMTLNDIIRHQHKYHEWRRWSVFEVLDRHGPRKLSARDRAALYHVARAELTTLPAGVGLSTTAIRYANELRKENPIGATVLHAAATWIARYWIEEESHHEVAYGTIADEMCGEAVSEDELVEHRQLFPTDNFLRNLMLQACVEVEAGVSYSETAKMSTDPLMKEVFTRVMRDEIQHRAYYISFSQALIDAGVYPAKDALAMAFTWLRPNGGELRGALREQQSQRHGYINWWEMVKTDPDDPHAIIPDQHYGEKLFAKKERSILKAVFQTTGQRYTTFEQLQRGYFKSLVPAKDRASASPAA
jgi:hypothetical protein